MQKGKKLEKEIKDYFKKNNIINHQFKDTYQARNFVGSVPCDFEVFPKKGKIILLEAKETKKDRLSLTAFRPSQWQWMKDTQQIESCTYYIIVKYKKFYYLFTANELLLLLDKGSKSFMIDEDIYAGAEKIDTIMNFMLRENEDTL